jgi:hypothetical protein
MLSSIGEVWDMVSGDMGSDFLPNMSRRMDIPIL